MTLKYSGRISRYWQPYHQQLSDTLTQMQQRFGVAILLDAHSIRSEVARFFAGSLPDFNLGTADGASCSKAAAAAFAKF